MSAPSYPDTLPMPQTAPFHRVQGVRASDLPGAKVYSSVERAFRGTQEVTFLFNSSQAAEFRDWWLNTLLRGGIWFTTKWPLPSGWFNPLGLRKFTAPPQWRHLAGGAWRVSAVTELITITDVFFLTITSLTYPVDASDEVESTLVLRNAPTFPDFEYAESGVSVLTGTLKTVLKTFTAPTEEAESGVSVLSGLLITYTFLSYTFHDSMIPTFAVTSGTLKAVLITYTIPPESVECGFSVLSGVLA